MQLSNRNAVLLIDNLSHSKFSNVRAIAKILQTKLDEAVSKRQGEFTILDGLWTAFNLAGRLDMAKGIQSERENQPRFLIHPVTHDGLLRSR
jgi:hypothetical protein